METREIPLTQGKVAVVDAGDYPHLTGLGLWYAVKGWSTWYACRKSRNDAGDRIILAMHRTILEAPANMHVDHRDGNGLNNCRQNLRLATQSQNKANTVRRMTSASGYKGVYWHVDKNYQRWMVQIRCRGKFYALGYFKDVIEAARAYDAAAKRLHGEFARLNFPEE